LTVQYPLQYNCDNGRNKKADIALTGAQTITKLYYDIKHNNRTKKSINIIIRNCIPCSEHKSDL